MADLENLLLEAAGRTGTSVRKPMPPRSHAKRGREGSYADDVSNSKYDDDSDDEPDDFASRRPSGSQIPLKKRLDPADKEDEGDSSHGVDDDDDDEANYHLRGGFGGDESDSGSFGSDLYKDDADREALAKMSELERERILFERGSRIDDNKLKQKVRASSTTFQNDKKITHSNIRKLSASPLPVGNRLSVKSTKSAIKDDALNELRTKKSLRQLDSDGYQPRVKDSIVGWSSSDGGDASRPIRGMPGSLKSNSSGSDKGSGNVSGCDASPSGRFSDSDDDIVDKGNKPTFEDIKEITIRRSKLAKWFTEPFFEELIVGCFVRVGIGLSWQKESMYRLCLVQNVDASDPDRTYKLENHTTCKYLNCVWGNECSSARWQMAVVSDSPPTVKEFDEWIREAQKSGGRMVAKKDVLEKKDAIQKVASTYIFSAETAKQILQEKKSTSTRPLNVAAEKDRLRKEMEVAENRHDEAEVERIRARLWELEASRRLKEDTRAARLAEMNRKNREENFKNASEWKPANTSLKAGDVGYDPFSRRWTRSRNYYASASVMKGGDEDDVNSVAGNDSAEVVCPAGEAATAAALEAAAGAGKLVDTRAPVDRGTELNALHDFELPISLAGLQKFGGPQGAHLGFMARKQRIEATIGVRVPENDGRRHTLTLTVSDYKRRRGLL